MRSISLEELLEAGCHFGHQVTRHNPKSRDFVFEARDNIHIIDLAKTKEGLEEAASFVKNLAQNGGNLLIVATKRQARPIVEEEIKRANEEITNPDQKLFQITSRWIGGVLTNFPEISKNIKKLKDISAKLASDEAKEGYTKKEIGDWEKERVKLKNFYGGIAEMKKSPEALFIIDTHLESLAVREARRTNVKIVGIVDTNADPAVVNYPIPANDDAVGSIKLIVSYIVDAWVEGTKHANKVSSHESHEKVAKDTKPEKEVKSVKKTAPKASKTKKSESVKKKATKSAKSAK